MSHSDSRRERGLLARAVGVLADPGPTFEDIVRSPDFVIPIVFIVLAGVLGLVPVVHTLETMPELFPSGVPMPSKSVTIGITLITSIVSQLIWWPLRALIFLGIGAFLGSKVDFRKSLAVSGYLNVTLVISGIITAIVIAVTGHAVVLGLGMTLSPEQLTTPWGVVLSNMNVFSLMYVALSSVALSKLWNVKTSKAALITIIMWILVIAVSAGSVHLGSKMTGLQVNVGVPTN
ncbi:MAG: YIP1 family protein [Firmicutes bacterium]|nr:YIP1 family protein [Bacillota bacterium]